MPKGPSKSNTQAFAAALHHSAALGRQASKAAKTRIGAKPPQAKMKESPHAKPPRKK